MPEKECKLSQKESKAFSKRQRLANLQGLAICCSTGCLKAGVKNSKPKRPQSLKIINFFFSSVFPFCYFCLVKSGFGTSCAHICCWERRHRPPNTKEPASAEPQLQVVPALLPSHPPASQLPFHPWLPCQVPCHLGSLSDHGVSPSFVRQGNAVTG